jgi:hypothetical protein
MSRRAILSVLALTVMGTAGASSPVAAQSLLSSTGLGLPLPPLDARSWGLGGIGVGLAGGHLLATDPAGAADLTIPSLSFTTQTGWVDATENDVSDSFNGTRFPSVAASYPISDLGTVFMDIGSVLDQRWRVQRPQTLILEGTGTEAKVTDTFLSDGGVSAVHVGLARRLSPSFAVGVTVGRYLGKVTRSFTRTFDSLEVETNIPTYQIGGEWTYGGLTATLGASAEVSNFLHVAGSWTWSADLKADPSQDTDAGGARYSMPSDVRVGAAAVLAPGLSLSAGLHRADWSATGDALEQATGQSVLGLGAGLEWSQANILGKPGAIRLGYRHTDLPFGTESSPNPTESAFTGGIGMNLLVSGPATLARLDLTLERGRRDAGALEERFWRLVTSLRVSGF